MNKSRIYWGSTIILVGLLLLFDQWGMPINVSSFWPVFLLLPGIFFLMQFFSKRQKPGLLIPASILIFSSAYFFFNQWTNHRWAGATSFVFILSVAVGLIAMYRFSSTKKRGVMLAAWILAGVALINLFSTIFNGRWWPIIIIAVGVFLLAYKQRQKEIP